MTDQTATSQVVSFHIPGRYFVGFWETKVKSLYPALSSTYGCNSVIKDTEESKDFLKQFKARSLGGSTHLLF